MLDALRLATIVSLNLGAIGRRHAIKRDGKDSIASFSDGGGEVDSILATEL